MNEWDLYINDMHDVYASISSSNPTYICTINYEYINYGF